MKNVKTFDEFVNENYNMINESEASADYVANFLKREEKHFAAFLKPKRINTTINGDIVKVTPASGSFTITVDFNKKEINSTGKPEHPESTSYVEIMEWIKAVTEFMVINESVNYHSPNKINEGTYDDFVSTYGKEAVKLADELLKLSKDFEEKFDESDIDKLFGGLERNYDEPVINMIDSIIFGEERQSLRDMGELAVQLSNKFGTEGNSIIMALEEVINKIKMKR